MHITKVLSFTVLALGPWFAPSIGLGADSTESGRVQGDQAHEDSDELISASDDEIDRWVEVLLSGGLDSEVQAAALSLSTLDPESSTRFVTRQAASFEKAVKAFAKDRKSLSRRLIQALGEAAKERARVRKEADNAVEATLERIRGQILRQAGEEGIFLESWKSRSNAAYETLRSSVVVQRSLLIQSDRALVFEDLERIQAQAPLNLLDQAFGLARARIERGPGGEEAVEKLRFPKTLDGVVGEYDWVERLEGLALGAGSKSDGAKVRKCLKPLMELEGPERLLYWDLIELRALVGLEPLGWDPRLSRAAALHADDMVRFGFFDHESPVPGRLTVGERARECGTRAHGECIARMEEGDGEDQASKPFDVWWGHQADAVKLLGDWRKCGAARVEDHWVLVFQK